MTVLTGRRLGDQPHPHQPQPVGGHAGQSPLGAVGGREAADVAELARLLRAQKRARELDELLDVALDTAQEQSSLIGLVNALWVAGLRKEVDRLVNRAMSKLPGPAVVDLADELRAVGREHAAIGLYAAAADTVATTRPVDTVAQLCQAMIRCAAAADTVATTMIRKDRRGKRDRIARALIDTVDGVQRALEVAMAFWNTAQDDYAGQALERAAVTLSNAGVLDLAAELRALGRDQAAFDLCLRAMVERPGSIRETVAALREVGRPVDAKKLFEAAAGQVPTPAVFDLLTHCGDTDRERVLTSAVLREPREVDELLDRLRPAQPAIAKRLITMMIDMMVSQPEFLPILLRRVDPQQKTQLLAWTLSTDGQKIVDRLSKAGLGHYADAVLVKAAASERPQHVIASHIVTLCDNGHSHAVNALLDKALEGQGRKEVQELVNVLRQQNHLATLAAIASWIKDTTDGESSSNYELLRVGLREYVDDRRQRR